MYCKFSVQGPACLSNTLRKDCGRPLNRVCTGDPILWLFTGVRFAPRELLAMTGDVFNCQDHVGIVASSRLRPGILLNAVQCARRSPYLDQHHLRCGLNVTP